MPATLAQIVPDDIASPSVIVNGTTRYVIVQGFTQTGSQDLFESNDGVTWTPFDLAHSPGGDANASSNWVLIGTTIWLVVFANLVSGTGTNVEITPYDTVSHTWGTTTVTSAIAVQGVQFSGCTFNTTNNTLVIGCQVPNMGGTRDGSYMVFDLGALTSTAWIVGVAASGSFTYVCMGAQYSTGRTLFVWGESDIGGSGPCFIFQQSLHDDGTLTGATAITGSTANSNFCSFQSFSGFIGLFSWLNGDLLQSVVFLGDLSSVDLPSWTATTIPIPGTSSLSGSASSFIIASGIIYFLLMSTDLSGNILLQYSASTDAVTWGALTTIYSQTAFYELGLQFFGASVAGDIEIVLFGNIAPANGSYYLKFAFGGPALGPMLMSPGRAIPLPDWIHCCKGVQSKCIFQPYAKHRLIQGSSIYYVNTSPNHRTAT